MKNVKLGLLCASLLFGMTAEAAISTSEIAIVAKADIETQTFKVYGNCGMCEKTIEGALKDVKGIEKADWNKETKMMEVSFNPKKITLTEIKEKIAAVGYDMDDFRSTADTYESLPGCCQYERPEK